MFIALLLHITSNSLFFITPQISFLAGLSTADALFKLDNFVRRYIDVSYKIMGIFLDVQKAFDCINHKLLLQNLKYSGIGVANK